METNPAYNIWNISSVHTGSTSDPVENQNSEAALALSAARLTRVVRFRSAAGNANSQRRCCGVLRCSAEQDTEKRNETSREAATANWNRGWRENANDLVLVRFSFDNTCTRTIVAEQGDPCADEDHVGQQH